MTQNKTKNLSKLLDIIHSEAVINNEECRQQTYAQSRENRKFPHLQVNDTVYVQFPNVFEKKIQGPYTIQKIISPVMIQIQYQNDSTSSPFLIHTNRILKLHKRKQKLCPQSTKRDSSNVQDRSIKTKDTSLQINDTPSNEQQNYEIKPSTSTIKSSYGLRQSRHKAKKDANYHY